MAIINILTTMYEGTNLEIQKIFEGGNEINSIRPIVGESYAFRLQLIGNNNANFDVTSSTLTLALYDLSGTLISTTPTITKKIDEMGIIEVSGITFNTSGSYNLYIISTIGANIKKFGPLRIYVGNGDNVNYLNVNVGENYTINARLYDNNNAPFDITTSTLTATLKDLNDNNVVITPTLTKKINSLGTVEIAGISWATTGTYNLSIVSTNGAIIKKFGPLRVMVKSL